MIANVSLLSSFQATTPPDKLFKNKHVEFVLVCIRTIKEVDQVFVCGEDQAFFESGCDLVKALVDLISAYYLFVPRSRTSTYGDRSFACVSPRLWNKLPDFIRHCETLDSFKTRLKTYLFKIAFNLL